MALLRPHPGTKRRPYFNWAHWGVGTSAHILAIAWVFIGIDLEMLDLPDYVFWVMVGYVLFHVVVDILLKLVIGIAKNGVERRKTEQYEMGKNGDLRMSSSDGKTTPPGSAVATAIIAIHTIGVLGVVATIIVNIALL
ncbi:putative ferric-chelate reductase 1 [Ptychodera flava]|uniref:putative ferric-chelate reductase 1 n=1 Tax=Ptychodera flava TaxID=63121 RepID=UPI003969C65C